MSGSNKALLMCFKFKTGNVDAAPEQELLSESTNKTGIRTGVRQVSNRAIGLQRLQTSQQTEDTDRGS